MRLRGALLGTAAAAALGLLAWQSVVTIDNGWRGVVERYGKPVRDLMPGLHLKLPLGMERVRLVEGPELSLPMSIGYRLLDDLQNRAATPRQKEWLTADNNIVELKANVLYSIRDAREFLYGVSVVSDLDPRSLKPASQRFALRRVAEAAFTEIVSQLSVESLLTDAASALESKAARERIQRDADALGLGIEVVGIQLLDRAPPSTVAAAFRQVQDAASTRAQSRTAAEAAAANRLSLARREAQRVEAEADYLAEREVLEAETRAATFQALHDVVGGLDSPNGRRLRMDWIRALLSITERIVLRPGTPEREAVLVHRQ